MAAEWDPGKARANFRKHGVRFADAVTALEDARAISVRDERKDEERWVSIGMDSLARILVVVYTWRDEHIRLISARPATRKEARQYEEGNEKGI
ncbi:MAG: BrnT family toxin [Acidobacteriota bacterium]|nr:BrnT family toxin [Acidobacteriota bacterium]